MADRIPREQHPWWIKLGLWGLPNRGSVMAFVWISIGLAAGCVIYAAVANQPKFYAGVVLLFSALAYWLSMRWVDRHGSWHRDAEHSD